MFPNASGTQYVDLTNEGDSNAINQLQYLSASENIYFRHWADAERIRPELEDLSQKRAQSGPTFLQYIRDDDARRPAVSRRNAKTGKIEKYRLVAAEEKKTARESLLLASFLFAEPTLWISNLKFRQKPKYFYNGSAVGHVRKLEWLATRRQHHRR